jgi:hypothetical protein
VFAETERSTVKRFLRVAIVVFVFVVLACLPVVPISIAPVVPNPTYSLRMVNVLRILGFYLGGLIGVTYRWHWYTFAAVLVLLAIGCLVSVWVLRKIGGPSSS